MMRAPGLTQHDDMLLLIDADRPEDIVGHFSTDVLVANVVRRWYLVTSAPSPTFEAAVAALAAQCVASGNAAAAVRIQCYPQSDEIKFMDALVPEELEPGRPAAPGAESDAAGAEKLIKPLTLGTRLKLSPRGWDLLLTSFCVGGWWCTGIIPKGGGAALPVWGNAAAKRRDTGDDGGVVSRAYFKLQEALARAGYVTHPHLAPLEMPPGPRGRGRGPMHVPPASVGTVRFTDRWGTPRVGIDVGSAPGGWSMFMARLGFERVYAIDPGDMSPALPAAVVVHVRRKAVAGITELLERPELHGAADLFACDMNCEVEDAVAALRLALPLLAPSCVCVVTLKNFSGSARRWEQCCREAVASIAALTGSPDVRVIHLLSNGPVEVTAVARLAAAAGGQSVLAP
jgi:hypothetical protein